MRVPPALVRRFTDYDDPNSVGSRMRARRSVRLAGVLAAAHARAGAVRVIDVGGRRSYWDVLPEGTMERYDVSVTVVNLPGDLQGADDERFTHVEGDGCALDVAENAYDVCHANSVLEHVGDWTRMSAFAGEVRRVASSYVVQTPYFWFPVEPHFLAPVFHWLPEPLRVGLMRRVGLAGAPSPTVDHAVRRVQSARLVDRVMFTALFPDAVVHPERVLGLTKSLVGVRDRG